MRYATAAAFRTALDERLKAEAAKTGLGLNMTASYRSPC
jgi:hypothetical protein